MFQLTAPLREPTNFGFVSIIDTDVSTHGSLAGADVISLDCVSGDAVSTHGSLAGADMDYQ